MLQFASRWMAKTTLGFRRSTFGVLENVSPLLRGHQAGGVHHRCRCAQFPGLTDQPVEPKDCWEHMAARGIGAHEDPKTGAIGREVRLSAPTDDQGHRRRGAQAGPAHVAIHEGDPFMAPLQRRA